MSILLQVVKILKDTPNHNLTTTKVDTLIQDHSLFIDSLQPIKATISNTHSPHTLIDSNALAAIIGALVTLMLTVFWDRFKSWMDAKKARKRKLKYFASLIKPIITYSEVQALNIQKVADEINLHPMEMPLLTYAPKSDLEKVVNRIDEEAFFDAFTKHYRRDSKSVRTFKEITSAIEYQNLQLEQVLEIMKLNQKFDHERKLKFKEYFETAIQQAGTNIANGSLLKHPDLLQLLNTHMAKYITERPSPADLQFAFEKFVEPVKKGITDGQLFKIPIGLDIATNLRNAAATYHDIRMHMNQMKQDIEPIAINYKKSNERLKKEAEKFLNDFLEI